MGKDNEDKESKQVQPNPENGDVLGAMKAQQANLSSLYQLQQVQNQSIESLNALQEFANSQLKQQTTLLTNLYQYLVRRLGPAETQHGVQNVNNPIGSSNNIQESLQNLSQISVQAEQASIDIQNVQQIDVQTATVNISDADLSNLDRVINQQQPTPQPEVGNENVRTIMNDTMPQLMMFQDLIADTQRTTSALDRIINQQEQAYRNQLVQLSDAIAEANNREITLDTDFETAQSMYHIEGLDENTFRHLQDDLANRIRNAFDVALSNADLENIRTLDYEQAQSQFDLGDMTEEAYHRLQNSLSDVSDNLRESIQYLTRHTVAAVSPADELADETRNNIQTATRINDFLTNALADNQWGSGRGVISAVGDVAGDVVGDVVGQISSGAISAALTPVLGPLAPVVGEIGGEIIGDQLDRTIGAAFDALGELWSNLENSGRKTRDAILQAGFDKVRQDVKAIGEYSANIYQSAVDQIYSNWDKSIGQVTATMGYTKEAINTLQDSVAQRLERLGYGQSINAANYIEELGSVLNANLNGTLAEAFATQNLILEKAVPELDMSGMAAQFAAIYTNAEKEGNNGEEAMTDAMNQIAGAVKAIEKTTDGNNQFISQVSNYLSQAQQIVNIAGGSVDKVANLTTEMMAAEGPLAALAPQISGFTGQLVTILTNQNDATAVALRSIMHDINNDIGISATDFMSSFMEDTKNTLVTAFEAIEQFIEKNENPAARQEFLQAMESLFGIQSEQLAQIDFGYIGEQLSQTNAHLNTSALLDAEALLKNGETATLEEQLVNNTANLLLAQNAVKDTLDNQLMRTIEKNELQLERLVYQESNTQSVDLAEDTMGFFTKITDIIVDLLDPFGFFKAANSAISSTVSAAIDAANYTMVANMSSIGSNVANDIVGAAHTMENTIGGAAAAITSAQATNGNAAAVQAAMDIAGVAGSTQSMLARQAMTSLANQQRAAQDQLAAQSEAAIGNYQNTLEEQQRQQEKAQQEEEQNRLREEAAAQNQQRASEEVQREQDNHDNLLAMSNQLPQINGTIGVFTETYVAGNNTLDTHIQQLKDDGINSVISAIYDTKTDVSKLDDIQSGIEQLVTLFSTYMEFLDTSLRESTGEGLRMSYSDRAQIMGRGLLI